MAAQVDNLESSFENEILPELEVTIMPFKNGDKVRMEIMNDAFCSYAIKQGVIESDMQELSWKRAGQVMAKLISIAPEFIKRSDNGKAKS